MRKYIICLMICIIICLIIFGLNIFFLIFAHKEDYFVNHEDSIEKIYDENTLNVTLNSKITVDDWRLVLVNHDNLLPKDFKIELSNIDKTRKFDSRAIQYLFSMMRDMKKDGIYNFWVQSAYRDPEYQENLYNVKKQEYIDSGLSEEEAEKLTNQTINKPWTSEHNLGLAVDFNYVDNDFEKTKAFEWLEENAEKYGFILRYKKEKEEITKIVYEPWHWRFVGEENAKEMNELDMCLEEYVEYKYKK